MIVTISTSGGIGGFGLAKSARVTVEDLPKQMQAETCARLDPGALEALKTRSAPPGAADGVTYHITVEDADAKAQPIDLPESALPGETLDLIDALIARGAEK